ncbi:hypothetical protein [Nocardioides sp. AX2bis]|uniref:hypothetical protein n=1 Tax=Nocardioides sp. AX2bis TaxID=2653157 RepID=UPI0012EFC7C9|nr:hypothetical protein [Nocardioides sp. AX2bis]VXC27903.1 conserved hypothetical protein [Nocardioides sp. AX2bis]
MDESPEVVRALLRRQDGVLARRQALQAGLDAADVRRMLRGRTWTTLLPGVYVDHTGRPSWTQDAWAAVLATWPAALQGTSALRAFDGPPPREGGPARPTIHVAVARRRARPAPLAGVVVHQVARLDETVLWNLGPPRQRYPDAVLDAAAAAGTELDRVAVLARAAGSRRTTVAQVVAALAHRTRYPRRRWTEDVLRDAAAGTCSVLEHRYLVGVERAHGLPRARRQQREAGVTGVVYRDVALGAAVVELDGRLHHDDPVARDEDLERDLDVAVSGRATVRLGWGQVVGRPCRTATKVAAFLRQHGVEAYARPCGPGCPVGRRPGSELAA